MASMIVRFSLYGFLKNQRYFEAFLVLALLERGLDFFQIGLLVAVREVTVNLLEVPSGAVADIWGRRRVMMASFASYVVSFVILGLAPTFAPLALGMVLYGVGDSCRTGTHKAMIFTWLRLEGRTDERVRVYGYTRSWSKIGSAVSVVLAAVIVIVTDTYAAVFLLSALPYIAGLVNFAGYPEALDASTGRASLRAVTRHMASTIGEAVRRASLRRLVLESMGFDGVFGAVKDYLQPVLQAIAVTSLAAAASGLDLSERQRTALLIGAVYVVLYVLAGAASRNAHRVATAAGGEDRAARRLWWMNALTFALLGAAALTGLGPAMVLTFVGLSVLHNLWRPILISRFDTRGRETQGASLLSIESQASRSAIMIVAPLLGWAIDNAGPAEDVRSYWPIAVVGLLVSVLFAATSRR